MSNCNWPLGNDESLGFTVYEIPGTKWHDVAGLYIFAIVTPHNTWHALYVGQTESFKDRLDNHDRWEEAQLLGARHIHALPVPLEANRDTLEKLLVQNLQPQLNVQLR